MSSATRRGGIPGPESRTGLTRPSMTEAEFERRLGTQPAAAESQAPLAIGSEPTDGTAAPRSSRDGPRRRPATDAVADPGQSRPSPGGSSGCSRSRRTWTRSSGSTPSTWARTGPRSSTTCSGRSSLRWSCTTRAIDVADGRRARRRPGRRRRGRAAELDAGSRSRASGIDDRTGQPSALGIGEEQGLVRAVLRLMEPGFERGQAEGLEHVLPAAQAGILGLDGREDGLAFGAGSCSQAARSLALTGLVCAGSWASA